MIGSERSGVGSARTAGNASDEQIALFGEPSRVLRTDEINLLVGSTDNEFEPGAAGYHFVPTALRWVITAIDGGAPGVGVGGHVGNDVAKTNIVAATANFMTVAQLTNAFNGGAPWVGITAQNTTTTTMVDGASRFKFDVTTPASGGLITLLRGRLFLFGSWVRL